MGTNIYKNKTFAELKEISRGMEAILRIGKNGLSNGVVSEIDSQLKKRHLVKIKMLPAFLDTEDRKIVALKLAKKTESKLVQQVGGVVVLYRK